MTINGILQIAIYLVVLILLSKPLAHTWRGISGGAHLPGSHFKPG